MKPRIKKLIGLVVLLPALGAYLLAAAALAEFVPAFWLAQLVYFIIAGVIWAVPMTFLMRWMNAEPSQNGN